MSDQIVYRVRHIPSGLYYKPGKKNLSKAGKIYPNKNTFLAHLPEGRGAWIADDRGFEVPVIREDFELVPFRLVWAWNAK